MEKTKSIADCFIILEDFIIKGNTVINETAALQALNRLNDFFTITARISPDDKLSRVESAQPDGIENNILRPMAMDNNPEDVVKYNKEIELQFGVNTELFISQKLIANTCDEIREMLLEKNRKYGNSALFPKRIFSKSSPIEQINVRIDDKLSRIESAQPDDMEDSALDLLEYLVLRKVAEKINKGVK